MIRTIITPNTQTVSFSIPRKYIGKELQVIAFEKEEGFEKKQFPKKFVSFDTISIDTKNFKFNRDEANER
jgi:hypothetical protein